MSVYNPKDIEKKWQDFWEEHDTYVTKNDYDKEPFFALVEFPYPSGQGLHVGHPRPYTALDIVARKKRYEGFNVLYPMGWDAFGLPTENYAIKNKIHPAKVTADNVARFKEQLRSIGFSFDWSREINTTDPDYYKWTQWIFLQLYKKGLAYKHEMPINWCPSCKVGLSNEEVIGGHCERCGTEVVRKVKSQWMLKITEYAERLINDLDDVDYIERVKTQQKNWIGRSEGAEIKFSLKDLDYELEIFTTRPDTIFGATYMVVAPEHPLIEQFKDKLENLDEIEAYKEEVSKKSDFERSELNQGKTGVELKGIKAVNPISNKEIPVWISDYVLMTYGSGAIMAVPAHDTRDWEFAKKFGLEIIPVIEGGNIEEAAFVDTNTGIMINSGFMNGLSVKEAIEAMLSHIEEKGLGHKKVNYKLRDWVFSRQRYWGEPIPLVYCEDCGWVPVPEEELPILLPDVENYEPTDDGESPLSNIDSWLNTTCPHCGKPAKRETDTMPQWAGSSWYYLRYTDPKNDKALADPEALKYWTPVNWYNGGMEHTTLHLLYSRFWHKFLYDLGIVPTKEPYAKRTSHGMILGGNGEKMSKSRGNVVNPDEIVEQYGADTLRTYEMFIGDFEKNAPWSENGVKGSRRFLERVWNLQDILTDSEEYTPELEKSIHKAIKKVSEDYENLKANTAIATLMSLTNEFNSLGKLSREDFRTFLMLLNPVAPHITEELWEVNKLGGYLNENSWPVYDESKTVDTEIEIPVQFNGKVRYTVKVSQDATQEEVKKVVEEDENYSNQVQGKQVVKEIYVPKKIYNIVVK
ncbi:leucyl-tRNA synthetase [Peptoniphilus asaccharolyticus DSM 20463]|uniref:Leucine--tRNA ligase n=1 Tax=Peptoniphilus asaccharolyticus DSM 20463 TaxID=573058 RepID=A0A1W1UW91_PEPAS|nr:leucine--tRNA ligase [Peptoniphilus asaccharolyticus]MBL7575284.1 leucine--tRNA ligase [Peptoniphilus asaccharolyticus]SMB85418.1 leucyl-tRNA synthetase [Peptoniphilus asaccharolyticus DSM 20463]